MPNNITFKQYHDELVLVESLEASDQLDTLCEEQEWSAPLSVTDLFKELGLDDGKL
jgi:hypothetical protein